VSKIVRTYIALAISSIATLTALGQVREQAAEPVSAGSSLSWRLGIEHGGTTLTVSRPDGLVIRREFAAGETPAFESAGEGGILPDGKYAWELVIAPRMLRTRGEAPIEKTGPGGTPAGRVVSGTFEVEAGAIRLPREIAERAPVAAAELVATPEDQVIPDDLIVQGSTCVGFDCVNNESFGFDTIRLKENNLRIKFEDTSTGSFPSNDWQLTANDSASGGANKFSIEDITGAKVPFTVTAGAATNSILVDSTGRVGFRTATPVLDLHVATSNTPAMRLEQNNSGGFTAQTWDIAGNEANFFIRDVTGGSRLSFRIRPGAPTSSLDIAADGKVGIGTGSPQRRLDVSNSGASDIGIVNTSGTAVRWFLQTDSDPNKTFKISREGGGGPVITVDKRLDANGVTFKVDGSVQATNVIFSSSRELKNELASVDDIDVLNRVAALPISKWTLKSDANAVEHVGPMAEDFHELFAVGGDAQHISVTDANGIALSAIKGLAQLLKERDEELAAMKARLTELENQLKSKE
jgi:hypothetical protein